MEYRELKKSEISKELFASFVRRQEVNAVLTRIDGQWREISRPFMDDWSPSDYDFLVKCLINTIETGGAVFGVFDEKGRLKAFASLEGGIFGRKHRYKDLSSLHVSAECRRSGIGKKLFCMAALKAKAMEAKLEAEAIDVTIPGDPVQLGHRHPMNKALDEAKDLFISMGFRVLDGPEVELADYNFTRLNIAENHPSRDRSDTFYITEDEKVLLRTQTSPMQIRAMDEIKKPPIRILAPGRVYRKDEVDATHSPMFHQIEGLVIDKGVTMADLKGTLETLIKAMYGEDSVIRFRPHHFPFTEPSCEVDVQCFKCKGTGCPTCKGEGWIELLGAGMVHPKVLENCDIDPEIYSGFAFGIGLERMAMRRFKISDMRMIFENDIRFLSQF